MEDFMKKIKWKSIISGLCLGTILLVAVLNYFPPNSKPIFLNQSSLMITKIILLEEDGFNKKTCQYTLSQKNIKDKIEPKILLKNVCGLYQVSEQILLTKNYKAINLKKQ